MGATDARPSHAARQVLARALASRKLRRLAALAAFGLALWLIWRALRDLSWADIVAAVAATPPSRIALSIALAALSYACLSATEWLALRLLGHRMTYREAARVAIPAYALTNSAGFSPATGAVFRVEGYGRMGLEPKASAAVSLVAGAAVTLSGLVALGVLFLAQPGSLAAMIHQKPWIAAIAGLVLLAPASLWFWAFTPQAPRWLGGRRPPPVPARLRALGLAAGLGDWLFSSAALFVLLPDASLSIFPAFLAASIAGALISAATGVPGGLGVFEALVLSFTSMVSQAHETAAALLLYRCVYSLGPLAIWGLVSLGRAGRDRAHRRDP